MKVENQYGIGKRLWLVATLLLAACQQKTATSAPQMPPPTAVTVAMPEQRELFDWEEMTGSTAARQSVEIRPRVSGYLTEVCYKPGQWMKEGEVMFVIDRRPAKAQLDLAEAQLLRAEAAAVAAQREASRADELLGKQAISHEEADQRRSAGAQAQAAVLAARASRDAAALDYEFTLVKSPIAGRASRELVSVGNFVSGVAGFTTLLSTVVGGGDVDVIASMDEAAYLRHQSMVAAKTLPLDPQGRPLVEMELMDEKGFPHRGYLESMDNRLALGSGRIALRAVFANPDQRLIPGLYVRMRLPGSPRYQAMLVAEEAIQTNQNLKFVYVVDAQNIAQVRIVQVGPVIEGKRVIRSGLQATDRVVVNGTKKVIPSMPVQPQTAAAADKPQTER